ncbi:unnamed protein product, partial [Brachionus calyciflorus]
RLIYFWTNDPKKANDWKKDGFKWRNQGGCKELPPEEPLAIKSYYHYIDRNGIIINDFTKNVYDDPKKMPLLIHSEADFEFDSGPDGNTKNKDHSASY